MKHTLLATTLTLLSVWVNAQVPYQQGQGDGIAPNSPVMTLSNLVKDLPSADDKKAIMDILTMEIKGDAYKTAIKAFENGCPKGQLRISNSFVTADEVGKSFPKAKLSLDDKMKISVAAGVLARNQILCDAIFPFREGEKYKQALVKPDNERKLGHCE